MAAATTLLVAAAVTLAAYGVAWATSDSRVGVLAAASVLAAAGLALLPAYRRRERGRLASRVAELRQKLTTALRATVERELEASHKRAAEAIAPYARFVRSEVDRLRTQQEELAALQKSVETLRGQVESLR
jgi:uncharacterized protein HemX